MGNLPFFWQSVVVILTAGGLIYLLTLGIGVYFSKDSDAHDVSWDETLGEDTNPAPARWFWSGIGATVFAIAYMIFYPSFGNYKGLFGSSNVKLYAEHKENIDNEYYKKLDALKHSDVATLQLNADAMKLASNTFVQYCASCHTASAGGQRNFPNLTDDAWIWGGSVEQITQTITHGRRAAMPSWIPVLGEEGVHKVASYIKSIADNTYVEGQHAVGKAKVQQFCVSCHGVNLQGNTLVGAPNLSDSAWIYGGDLDTIKTTITKGRNGVMPAHENRLTKLQIKLLAAWLTRNN